MQERIGRYEIVERIAAGGQATVYRARDSQLGRFVALKVMHPHLAHDADYVERFLREARMAAALSCPNVAVIHEVGEENGAHFIAMEFLPSSLDALIKERGKLPWQEAVRFAQQVAAALQAADAQGIVHRDLKPQNILLAADGTAKVTDFGIARAAEFASMTATGMVMGTPSYMSPEQARGERVDIRSDLYSLGVVLFQMLTGRVPLESRTPQEVLTQHLQQLDCRSTSFAAWRCRPRFASWSSVCWPGGARTGSPTCRR
jgi:serine/threonine-protein kinase